MFAQLPYPGVAPIIDEPGFLLTAFDLLVAIAVVTGVLMSERRAQRLGLDRRVIVDATFWAVVPGFIVSHLVSLVFYFPERLSDWRQVVNIFAGMSSLGGFIGGAAGVAYFMRRRNIPLAPYSNAIVYGFTLAWIFGRLGCTIAFDHPGVETGFILGMEYPGGRANGLEAAVRHNLGFYEMLWACALAAFFWTQRTRPHIAGWHLTVFVATYTPLRFLFDFLREKDLRYLGLTAAQYALIGVLVVTWLAWKRWKAIGELVEANGEVHIFADGRPALPLQTDGPQPETP